MGDTLPLKSKAKNSSELKPKEAGIYFCFLHIQSSLGLGLESFSFFLKRTMGKKIASYLKDKWADMDILCC